MDIRIFVLLITLLDTLKLFKKYDDRNFVKGNSDVKQTLLFFSNIIMKVDTRSEHTFKTYIKFQYEKKDTI